MAITLRIVLVENLRRLAERIVSSRAARAGGRRARRPAARRRTAASPSPSALLARYERRRFAERFAVQLVQRLRDQDPKVDAGAGAGSRSSWRRRARPPTSWCSDEHQRQGATNVTVRNIITSMRLISDVDWAEFFESVSLVDDVLRAGSDFAAMDFATRNLYRSAIEELARGSELAELEIARRALEAAASSPERERRSAASAIPAIT